MSVPDELLKYESKVFAYVLFFIALVVPGAGYLFLHDKNLFLSLELGQFFILSIFYSTPIIILGILYNLASNKGKKIVKAGAKENDSYKKLIQSVSLFTIVSYFLSTFGYFISNKIFTLLTWIYAIPASLVVLAIITTIIQGTRRKGRRS